MLEPEPRSPLEAWLLPEEPPLLAWLPAEELPLLAWPPPELLPELPLELRGLEPALDEELPAPELPLLLPPPPPELGLAYPEPAELDPEEPELCTKLSRGNSRRGSEDRPPPAAGAESAAVEVAPEPDPLPPLLTPPEPDVG